MRFVASSLFGRWGGNFDKKHIASKKGPIGVDNWLPQPLLDAKQSVEPGLSAKETATGAFEPSKCLTKNATQSAKL